MTDLCYFRKISQRKHFIGKGTFCFASLPQGSRMLWVESVGPPPPHRWKSRDETGPAQAELQPEYQWPLGTQPFLTDPSPRRPWITQQTHLRKACTDRQRYRKLHPGATTAAASRLSYIMQASQKKSDIICTVSQKLGDDFHRWRGWWFTEGANVWKVYSLLQKNSMQRSHQAEFKET